MGKIKFLQAPRAFADGTNLKSYKAGQVFEVKALHDPAFEWGTHFDAALAELFIATGQAEAEAGDPFAPTLNLGSGSEGAIVQRPWELQIGENVLSLTPGNRVLVGTDASTGSVKYVPSQAYVDYLVQVIPEGQGQVAAYISAVETPAWLLPSSDQKIMRFTGISGPTVINASSPLALLQSSPSGTYLVGFAMKNKPTGVTSVEVIVRGIVVLDNGNDVGVTANAGDPAWLLDDFSAVVSDDGGAGSEYLPIGYYQEPLLNGDSHPTRS